MKLQKYHIVRGFPYKGDMPPEVENYTSAFIGMAYDVQEVDREIERLEAENAKLHNRIGSLTLDNDLLRRGAADDALTIHTCEEIIDRIKKENGDFRAKNSDLEKEIAKLRALVERAGELDRAYVGEDIDKFCEECREALK